MPTSRHFHAKAWLTAAASLVAAQAYADQLVYVPLAQPCRLLDTRTSTGGSGLLAQSHGAYLFGTSAADISGSTQHGSASGCGIPTGVAAVSVNMNLFSATAAGNIVTWSADAGATAPNIGTAVYNPTVGSPAPGQVQYNTGYTTVPVGALGSSNPGRFYLQVANGQIDVTINLVGYWLPVSWAETRDGYRAVALGDNAVASGSQATAIGPYATAKGDDSIAVGTQTTASGNFSTAMGYQTLASGNFSTAMGYQTTASGAYSTAMGYQTTAGGTASLAQGINAKAQGIASTAIGNAVVANGSDSIALGSNVQSDHGAFIFGDGSARTGYASKENQFVGIATGGVLFYTDPNYLFGASLAPGSGSWTAFSDRNAKTAVRPVKPREVLEKVIAIPLNTWQYKAQDAKYRHMGPMAQDFYAAFQLGETDKGIDTVDADGVALAAIQGLNALLTEKDEKTAARLEEKDREIASLRAELSAQKNRVTMLESLAGDMAELKAQLVTLRRLVPTEVAVVQQQP